jgi:hypothetical protein
MMKTLGPWGVTNVQRKKVANVILLLESVIVIWALTSHTSRFGRWPGLDWLYAAFPSQQEQNSKSVSSCNPYPSLAAAVTHTGTHCADSSLSRCHLLNLCTNIRWSSSFTSLNIWLRRPNTLLIAGKNNIPSGTSPGSIFEFLNQFVWCRGLQIRVSIGRSSIINSKCARPAHENLELIFYSPIN